MTTIHAKAQDQVLVATILPKLACNNQNTVKLHVEFDSAWDGYAKTALFFTSTDPTVYPAVLNSSGECIIPAEVLTDAGHLFITIQGANSASTQIKSTTPIRYKILPGTPSLTVSDPSQSVYNQLASRDVALAAEIATERARISSIIALKDGSTTGDAELKDARKDFTGLEYASAGDAIRSQTKKLTKGRFGFATLLPSSIGDYPAIDTVAKTFTIGGDTLIINDRIPGGFVSLHANNGNNIVTWGDEITSSAICFYYDIDTNSLVALPYNAAVVDYNYILLATLRTGHGASAGKSWAICSSPIYVNGHLSTEVNAIGGFAALLPPMYKETGSYPKVSTVDNTFTAPHDMLIVDPRLPDGFVSLKSENGNDTIYFGDYATSAICIYYGIEEKKLVAKPFHEVVNNYDYLLLCTIRKLSATDAGVSAMAWASCPVWIDDRLSTEPEKTVVFVNNIVKSINHRGYCTEAPENTLSAFRLSKKKGFEYVECDVSFTSDGYAVLLHDSTVDRTSNGTGSINAMTLAQVRALDFGSWKSGDYAGEMIPRFEEFLALCRKLGLHPYIELKEGTEAQIKALVGVVKRHGMNGKVTWISFNSAYLGYIKAVDPKARLGFVVDTVTASTITTAKNLLSGSNEVFIDCSAANATAEAVELCAAADIPLEVWTVNSENTIKTLDAYVTGVTSDNLIAGSVLAAANID